MCKESVSFKKAKFVVSHRGPLVINKNKNGQFFSRSVSGLVSAVRPIIESVGGMWIAWCGRKSAKPREKEKHGSSTPENPKYKLKEMSITPENTSILSWLFQQMPLASLPQLCRSHRHKSRFWNQYVQVNTGSLMLPLQSGKK